ncbi:MAG: glycosyltransferase family 4 protein [Acidobacteria bacterium]|nr:glycosyltransferase family 4 protein [Acidobacteriota bacterium]
MKGGLLVVETHPIQYHVPVYRLLQQAHGIPVTVVYGTDASLYGYRDQEFGADVTWDVDLLSGYTARFLSKVEEGGNGDPMTVSARGIGRMLDAVRPAAVLIVGYSPAFHRWAWTSAWRRGLPILFRGETTDIHQTTRRDVMAARDIALRIAYRTCARLLYIGERARRHYRAHGVGDERLVFSPYCVDLAPFECSEADRARLRQPTRAGSGVADDRLMLVFSGKLSPRKGVDLILPAVRRLPDAIRSRVVVVCAGDGALRAALEAEATARPPIPLIVLGVQPQAGLSRWYHAADLLVLPSRQAETWGLVVNEALHHGLPVVVSDRVGCAPDLVDASTGGVCAADSCASLAATIERATAALVERAEIREACRAKVRGYSLARAAAGIAEAYRGATAGRPAA